MRGNARVSATIASRWRPRPRGSCASGAGTLAALAGADFGAGFGAGLTGALATGLVGFAGFAGALRAAFAGFFGFMDCPWQDAYMHHTGPQAHEIDCAAG
jgi:hypothetical protein